MCLNAYALACVLACLSDCLLINLAGNWLDSVLVRFAVWLFDRLFVCLRLIVYWFDCLMV